MEKNTLPAITYLPPCKLLLPTKRETSTRTSRTLLGDSAQLSPRRRGCLRFVPMMMIAHFETRTEILKRVVSFRERERERRGRKKFGSLDGPFQLHCLFGPSSSSSPEGEMHRVKNYKNDSIERKSGTKDRMKVLGYIYIYIDIYL